MKEEPNCCTSTILAGSEHSVSQDKQQAKSKRLRTSTLTHRRKKSTSRTSQMSQSIAISETTTQAEELTYSQADSLVLGPAQQEAKQDLTMQNLQCGLNTSDALMKADPVLSSSKTQQDYSIAEWGQSFKAYPRSGTMRNGRLSALPCLEVPKKGSECSSLPIPTLTTGLGSGRNAGATRSEKWLKDKGLLQSTQALNPQMMELLFNFPKDWTKCLWESPREPKDATIAGKFSGEPSTLTAPPSQLRESSTLTDVSQKIIDAMPSEPLEQPRSPQKGDVIAIWFSNGVASAVAAKKTIEKYGELCQIRILNNPVAEEDADNLRFQADCEKWLGYKIEKVVNENYPNASAVEVWEKRKFMSSPFGAPCTLELKKKARQQWEKANHHDWLVMGFTSEETERHEKFVLTERDNLLPILIEAKLSKQECANIILAAGIDPPNIYKRGYPNANCIGCVKSASPTYWNLVRKEDPDIFEARAKQSREIGARLVKVKGKRIFLDELSPEAKGNSLKSMSFECGIFCEEKSLSKKPASESSNPIERLEFLRSERDRLINSGASPQGVWLERSKPAGKNFVQVVWKSSTPRTEWYNCKSRYIGKENSDEHLSAIAQHTAGQQLRKIEREIRKLETNL